MIKGSIQEEDITIINIYARVDREAVRFTIVPVGGISHTLENVETDDLIKEQNQRFLL